MYGTIFALFQSAALAYIAAGAKPSLDGHRLVPEIYARKALAAHLTAINMSRGIVVADLFVILDSHLFSPLLKSYTHGVDTKSICV